ncbi:MAG: hypothetical protein GY950_15510, partial [bacterium]|nr:hypothetical protein [bacterium]
MPSIIEKMLIFVLKGINRLTVKKPRRPVDSRNVLIYSPNIGGHRAIYASKFINYFQKHDVEIFFIYCGLLLPPKRREYSEYRSAFLDSFKAMNREWFTDVQSNLVKGSMMGQLFQEKRYFSDLAVQIHFGSLVDGENLGWHIDSRNSAIHLALSIRGRRDLLVAYKNENGEKEIAEYPQEEGDAYVSNPCVAGHAVRYHQSTWDTRIIAVQCRILLTMEELTALGEVPKPRRVIKPRGE